MTRDKAGRDELLLDFHLDKLSNEDREWIEAELLRDAGLRTRSDRLGQYLRPLDYWTTSPPPSAILERVLASFPARARQPVDSTGAAAPGPRSFGPFRSLRELVTVAACLVAVVGVALPGAASLRSRAQRTMCASNLGSIFRGVTLYQQAFAGALPYAGNPQPASWLPVQGRTVPFASNSRHLYLIAKLNYGPEPKDFVCPSAADGKAMRADELARHDDFARCSSIRYASLNMAGPRPNLRPRGPIAYVSDMNPLFVGGRFNDAVNPNTTNSPAHGGHGQSVLILDGSVVYLSTPVYGIQQDNLWLAGSLQRYAGTEAADGEEDAFLIPGYPASDHASLKY